jgi:hypothetical protein
MSNRNGNGAGASAAGGGGLFSDLVSTLRDVFWADSPVDVAREQELRRQRDRDAVKSKSQQSLAALRSTYESFSVRLRDFDAQIAAAESIQSRAVDNGDRATFARCMRALGVLRGRRRQIEARSQGVFAQITAWEDREQVNEIAEITSELHEFAAERGVPLVEQARKMSDVLEADAAVDDEIRDADDEYVHHGSERLGTLVAAGELDAIDSDAEFDVAWAAAQQKKAPPTPVAAPAVVAATAKGTQRVDKRLQQELDEVMALARLPALPPSGRAPRGPQAPPAAATVRQSKSSASKGVAPAGALEGGSGRVTAARSPEPEPEPVAEMMLERQPSSSAATTRVPGRASLSAMYSSF